MTSPTGTTRITKTDERQRAALLARIERQFATMTQTVAAGGVSIDFTRVADPDAVFDRMAEQFSDSQRDDAAIQPYWAKAWESNLALAESLTPFEMHGRRVLDLGCGLGLIGAILAARGASVWLADVVSPSLLFAKLNVWPWLDRCEVVRFDWRRDRFSGVQFDWIIGSDILYDRAEWPYLEPLWRQHLAPGGTVVLGEPFRIIGDEFREWIGGHPWQVRVDTVRPAGVARPLRLFWLADKA
ncbi:MAG: methyltransferase domain-containing protein [Planctomycetales bacterium]|nr:methyltransferase domain-containing protein [Planctomycetales bacterium]